MDEILETIRNKYKSLEEPSYSFVHDSVQQQPYKDVVQQVSADFQINDDTDVNDDVSFGYLLKQENQTWVLRLSMVGRYAALLRVQDSGKIEVISDKSVAMSNAERKIISILESAQIRLLSKDELGQPIAIQLNNADPENTRLYQALFTDTDVLPWEA